MFFRSLKNGGEESKRTFFTGEGVGGQGSQAPGPRGWGALASEAGGPRGDRMGSHGDACPVPFNALGRACERVSSTRGCTGLPRRHGIHTDRKPGGRGPPTCVPTSPSDSPTMALCGRRWGPDQQAVCSGCACQAVSVSFPTTLFPQRICFVLISDLSLPKASFLMSPLICCTGTLASLLSSLLYPCYVHSPDL